MAGEENIGGIAATVSVDTAGIEPGMAKLQAAIMATQQRLDHLNAEFAAGRVNIDAYNAQMDRLQAEFAATSAAAVTAASAVTKVGDHVTTAGGLSGNASNKIQMFGQTLDDLQYVPEMGLRPIINNLMQMSPVLGIAAIAVNVLWQNWSKLFGEDAKALSAVEEMKELGKQTRLTADEQERLNLLKGQEAGKAANLAGTSAREKKVLSGVSTAIDEADYGAVKKAVQATREEQGLMAGMTDDDRAELAHARMKDERKKGAPDPLGLDKWLFGAETFEQKKRAEIKKRLEVGENEAVDAFLGKARGATGPEAEGARKALLDMAKANPARFGGRFATNMETALKGGDVVSEEKAAELKAAAKKKADKDLKENLDKAERENKKHLQTRFDTAALEHKKEEKGNEVAADAAHKAGLGRVADLAKVQEEKEKVNAQAWKALDVEEKGNEKRLRLEERGSDLKWKLMNLMHPERQGQTLGGDAYAGSFHSQTGLSEEAKRLHNIWEVNKEIAENTRQLKMLRPGVSRR